MKNTFGNNVSVTLFGESHGECIGAVIDGIFPGMDINEEYIEHMMSLRKSDPEISTPRREEDRVKIVSGVVNQKATGTPLTIIIPNENVKSGDYNKMRTVARPSHADYTAECRYHGFQDSRGGGHFSGRITAALVAAGSVLRYALEQKGIFIGTHIKKCGNLCDREFEDIKADIAMLNSRTFAVLDSSLEKEMKNVILEAAGEGDSVGGILETVVYGMPGGIGEPWFDSVEGMLSHMMFSIPAVKGIEFGAGFALSEMRGSNANDLLTIENGKIVTETNNNGGINGGITNGMPIVFRTAVKPTPTIFKPQKTVDFKAMTETVIEPCGRHDPCIVHRARAVQDAATAIVIYDMLSAGGK